MKGNAFQGKIKFGRFNKNEASVTSSVLNKEIVIIGPANLNRAIHGDKVVVELQDPSQWIGIEQHQLQTDEVVEETED
jgi:exoribonuclease R